MVLRYDSAYNKVAILLNPRPFKVDLLNPSPCLGFSNLPELQKSHTRLLFPLN